MATVPSIYNESRDADANVPVLTNNNLPISLNTSSFTLPAVGGVVNLSTRRRPLAVAVCPQSRVCTPAPARVESECFSANLAVDGGCQVGRAPFKMTEFNRRSHIEQDSPLLNMPMELFCITAEYLASSQAGVRSLRALSQTCVQLRQFVIANLQPIFHAGFCAAVAPSRRGLWRDWVDQVEFVAQTQRRGFAALEDLFGKPDARYHVVTTKYYNRPGHSRWHDTYRLIREAVRANRNGRITLMNAQADYHTDNVYTGVGRRIAGQTMLCELVNIALMVPGTRIVTAYVWHTSERFSAVAWRRVRLQRRRAVIDTPDGPRDVVIGEFSNGSVILAYAGKEEPQLTRSLARLNLILFTDTDRVVGVCIRRGLRVFDERYNRRFRDKHYEGIDGQPSADVVSHPMFPIALNEWIADAREVDVIFGHVRPLVVGGEMVPAEQPRACDGAPLYGSVWTCEVGNRTG